MTELQVKKLSTISRYMARIYSTDRRDWDIFLYFFKEILNRVGISKASVKITKKFQQNSYQRTEQNFGKRNSIK